MAGQMSRKSVKDYTFKYDGINPLTKLRPGEPYFFIRAQDKFSVEAIQAYGDLLKAASERAYCAGDESLSGELYKQALSMLKIASAFADWQLSNPGFVKYPD